MIKDDPRIDLIEAQIEPLGASETWCVAGIVAAHLVRRAKVAMWRGLSRARTWAIATGGFASLAIAEAGLLVALAWR